MAGAPHEYAAGPADESLDGVWIAAGARPAVSAPSTLTIAHARTKDERRMGTSLGDTGEILSAASALVNHLDEREATRYYANRTVLGPSALGLGPSLVLGVPGP